MGWLTDLLGGKEKVQEVTNDAWSIASAGNALGNAARSIFEPFIGFFQGLGRARDSQRWARDAQSENLYAKVNLEKTRIDTKQELYSLRQENANAEANIENSKADFMFQREKLADKRWAMLNDGVDNTLQQAELTRLEKDIRIFNSRISGKGLFGGNGLFGMGLDPKMAGNQAAEEPYTRMMEAANAVVYLHAQWNQESDPAKKAALEQDLTRMKAFTFAHAQQLCAAGGLAEAGFPWSGEPNAGFALRVALNQAAGAYNNTVGAQVYADTSVIITDPDITTLSNNFRTSLAGKGVQATLDKYKSTTPTPAATTGAATGTPTTTTPAASTTEAPATIDGVESLALKALLAASPGLKVKDLETIYNDKYAKGDVNKIDANGTLTEAELFKIRANMTEADWEKLSTSLKSPAIGAQDVNAKQLLDDVVKERLTLANKAALNESQNKAIIGESGDVSKKFTDNIGAGEGKYAANDNSDSASKKWPTFTSGEDKTKFIQEWLERAGHSVGIHGVDGKWGPDTNAAYLAALKAAGIIQDGAKAPGQLNDAQQTQLITHFAQAAASKTLALVEAIDVNKDGKVTAAEMKEHLNKEEVKLDDAAVVKYLQDHGAKVLTYDEKTKQVSVVQGQDNTEITVPNVGGMAGKAKVTGR